MIARTIRLWKRYTFEEKEYIRLHDDGTDKTRFFMAEKLGRSLAGIRHECGRQGLQKWRTDDWQPSEDDYLREHVGRLSIKVMARELRRAVGKTTLRINFLHLTPNSRDGWYGTNDVAFGFGCSHQHILDLIYEGKLKAKQDGGRKIWVVKKDSLYDYITKYPMSLDGKNCEMVFIVDILTDGDIKYTTGADRCRKMD